MRSAANVAAIPTRADHSPTQRLPDHCQILLPLRRPASRGRRDKIVRQLNYTGIVADHVGAREGKRARPGETEPVVEAVRALSRVSRACWKRASDGLSLSHYRVLSAIAAGDERASRVAGRLAVGKPTISATVESLSQRGLLARSTVKGDHRAAALRLTAQGEALLARVEADMAARLEDLCSRTPDGGQLIESLMWLGVAIEADAAERQARLGRDRR